MTTPTLPMIARTPEQDERGFPLRVRRNFDALTPTWNDLLRTNAILNTPQGSTIPGTRYDVRRAGVIIGTGLTTALRQANKTAFDLALSIVANNPKLGALYFPPGTCEVLANPGDDTAWGITQSNLTICGDGAQSVIKEFTDGGASPTGTTYDGKGIFSIIADTGLSVDDVTIRDLKMVNSGSGHNSYYAGLGLIYAVGAGTMRRPQFLNLTSETRNRSHITLGVEGAMYDCLIQGCEIIGKGETGIYLSGNCNRPTVIGNRLIGDGLTGQPVTSSPGMSIRRVFGGRFIGNYVRAFDIYGILVRDSLSEGVIIAGNTLEDFAVGTTPLALTNGRRILAIGNDIVRAAGVAIAVGFTADNAARAVCEQVTVAHNSVYTAGTGINVSNLPGPYYVSRVRLIGNQIHDVGTGIAADDVDYYLHVYDNALSRPTLGGTAMNLYSTRENVRVRGNEAVNFSSVSIASQIECTDNRFDEVYP